MVAATPGGVAVNFHVLHHIRARLTTWLAVLVLLSAFSVSGGLSLVLVLADAAFDLSESTRVAVPWVLGLALVAVCSAGFVGWRRLNESRMARWFEQSDAALGNRLINAVQLAQKKTTDATEEFFRREVVELGRQTSENLDPRPLVRRGLRRAGIFLGGVLAAWLALVALNSDLVQTILPRLFDAHGDHPPYSRLRIDVKTDKSQVLYGGQVEVRAVTSGMPVEKLWLVARSGTNEMRAIMFLAPDKSFFQTLVNLREPTDCFVTDGKARSRKFSVGIRFTPQITMIEVATTFPEYTGKLARTNKWSGEPQSLPEGTRVKLRVASNRPLKSGVLQLAPVLGGKTNLVALSPEIENVVTGVFVLSQAVVFDLSVRDAGGLESVETRRGRFNILPDRPPKLFVLEPGRDAVATPDFRVPVRVRAEDDYAVSRVVWLRSHNRSIERPLDMKLALKPGPQSVEASGAFELDKLGVKPGDVIEYYFEAADNYPAGPNVAFSRPFRLQIISQEDYDRILRQAAARKALFEPYLQLDSWMRRLAERSRNAASQAGQNNPDARKSAEELAKELAKYDEALGKLMQDPVMFDVENSFRATLGDLQSKLGELSEKLKQTLDAGGTPDAKKMKELSEALSQMAKTQDEQVEKPAQQIASVVSVVSRADTFVKLAQQQAALAQMLRRFADKTNALSRLEQMEVQELTHQQQRVGEALHEMVGQLPELLAKVPTAAEYDPLRNEVNQFLKAVADAKIEELLTNTARSLEQPDSVTGHALAQFAADEMAKLIGRCKSMGDQAQQCSTAHFKPKLCRPGLGETLQQVMSALNSGNGQEGGHDGYAIFNEAVALYGPNVQLAGEQAGGSGTSGEDSQRGLATFAAGPSDENAGPDAPAGKVRLQTDAKFPLRYRDLVGEYFRVMGESGKENEK
jgi:hypothetical protein